MDAEQNQTEEQQTETPEAPEQEQAETLETPPEEPAEKTEASAEGEEEEEESQGTDEEQDEATGKGGHRRKTGVQRNRERLEREREQWAQERAFYQAQLAQQQSQRPPTDAPKLTPEEQFQQYLDARVNQGVNQVLFQREQETASRQLEQKWEQQISGEEDGGYQARRLLDVARRQLAPGPIKDALLTSEYAPKILSVLQQDPRELARISALPEGQAAREIGRLEARFAAGAAPANTKPKPVNRPPPPPTTVGGSTRSTRDAVDLPLAEYKRRYRSGR